MHVHDWQEFIQKGSMVTQIAGTIGVFDGVHRGHQALIEKIVRQGPHPTVITFRQSPKQIMHPEMYEGDILSLDQKLAIFEDMGVFQTILIDFSEIFSKLKGQEFIDLLIDRGSLCYLAIGSNFRCGYRLDTDAALIKRMNEEKGIKTDVVESVLYGSCPVSSSMIRKAIVAGDLRGAAAALGRNVAIDLRGLSVVSQSGGMFFDLFSHYRIIPPAGQYLVWVYEQHSERKKIEITIEKGTVFIPSPFNAVCIEFVRDF